MKRREILQRRKYAACPKAILARRDLTSSDKVVCTTMIGFLFSDDAEEVQQSAAEIARASGMSRRTAVRSLENLEAAGLIAGERRPGFPTVYTFIGTGEPVPNLHTPCAKSAHPYKEVNVSEHIELPPLPPNRERDDSPPPNQSQDEKNDNDIIDAIGQAFAEATGRKLPDNWAAAAGKQLDSGHRAILEEIDAEAIRGAQAYARKRDLAFGFRTLLLWIHQTPRTDTAAQDKAASQAEAARAIAQAAGEAEQQEREAATRAAALAYFQSEALTETDRQGWRDRVAKLPGYTKCGPDGQELIAAIRAFSQKTNRPSDQRQARA